MDADSVEVSNLHRQIVHTESAAEMHLSKVRSAAARCRELNSEILYVLHEERASGDNILEIIEQYDLVLDCTDNPATRYLISDACVVSGKVLISGAAQRAEGTLMVLNSPPISHSESQEKGPCYRCVFPRPPAPETVKGCSEIGVLGPVVGTIGTLMAAEAIKIISSGAHFPLSALGASGFSASASAQKTGNMNTMLLYNAFSADPRGMFRTITLRGRRKDCVACGDDEDLARKGIQRITADVISQGRLDYQAFCGIMEDVNLLGEDKRIEAQQFLKRQSEQEQGGRERKRALVIDVREDYEYELGAKIKGSVNIPISRILRHGGGAFDSLRLPVGQGPDGGMVDDETHIPITTYSLPPGPDGGMINAEAHIPVIKEPTAVSPDGGMINDETHIPLTKETVPISPDGGMINQETHIPVRKDTIPITITPDGGMINDETHIPITSRGETRVDEEDLPTAVYFVCQRGNDSQIAAQKLIEKIEADSIVAGSEMARRKWGWIGDVKGGFLAMETRPGL